MAGSKKTSQSVRGRIEAFLLKSVGRVLSSDEIKQAARDPETYVIPENWHQRLSELRVDYGYTILTNRDRPDLKPGQYLMPDSTKRAVASRRILPTAETWTEVLRRANNTCEWTEGGQVCRLAEGDIDPVGGGTVRLTADHVTPHSVEPNADPGDASKWRALCGRHQVMKKNFWDSASGKLNVIAILQAATVAEKRKAFEFLTTYFTYPQRKPNREQ